MRGALALVALLSASASAAPRTAYLDPPRVGDVRLAPDGQSVLVVEEDKLYRQPLDGGRRRLLLGDATETDFLWSTDSGAIFFAKRRGRDEELAAIELGGGTPRVLLKLRPRLGEQLLGVDPSRPRAMLTVARVPEGFALQRIDPRGTMERLAVDPRPILDAALTRDGRVAYLRLREADARQSIVDGAGHTLKQLSPLAPGAFVGVDAATGRLLLRAREGGDLERLLRLDPEPTTLSVDPLGEVDLDAVVSDSSGRPRLALYDGRVVGLDEEARAVLARLPATENRRIELSTPDGPWLIVDRDARWRAPRRQIYWPGRGAPTPLFAEEVGGTGTQTLFRWTASDGRKLQGYVTLPAGADPRRVPVVVEVHGGPWQRARGGWAGGVQMLAERGYAVFQPNFRGSTGFGADHVLAARDELGRGRVLGDVLEGVDALLASGVGDPARLAIAGHSFGGYTALLAVGWFPGKFRVAFAGAPPTDFGWVAGLHLEEDDPAPNEAPRRLQLREAGIDVADRAWRARMTAESPLAAAPGVSVPVWLLAGGADERVPWRTVSHYAARLRTLGKTVHLYVDPEAGHAPVTRLGREGYYFLLETALAESLGGPAPAPPSPALREYLERTRQPR
jgi:dienelactone hydrolase